MKMQKVYLVEIRTKDWIVPQQILSLEEVISKDEYYARHMAFDQYMEKVKNRPIAHRKWEQSGLTIQDICAPEAVELEE